MERGKFASKGLGLAINLESDLVILAFAIILLDDEVDFRLIVFADENLPVVSAKQLEIDYVLKTMTEVGMRWIAEENIAQAEVSNIELFVGSEDFFTFEVVAADRVEEEGLCEII